MVDSVRLNRPIACCIRTLCCQFCGQKFAKMQPIDFIIVFPVLSACLASLLRGPSNMAVVRGSNKTMSCDFGSGNYNVAWYHRAVQKSKNTTSSLNPVNNGNKPNKNFSEFNLGGSVSGQMLFLNNIQLKHAGIYQCAARGYTAEAQLIVLEFEPKCNFSVFESILSLTCVVQFNGLWIPQMQWLESVDGQEHSRFISDCNEANYENQSPINLTLPISSTSSSTKYVFKLNFKDISCLKTKTTANNTPKYEYTWKPYNLPYGPLNVTVSSLKSTYHWYERLTCNADSNPLPEYEWRNKRNNIIVFGQYLSLANVTTHEEPHVFRCRAINKLLNTSADSASVIFSVVNGEKEESDRSSNVPFTVVGLSLTFVVFMIIFIILLAIRCKKVPRWRHRARILHAGDEMERHGVDLVDSTHRGTFCENKDWSGTAERENSYNDSRRQIGASYEFVDDRTVYAELNGASARIPERIESPFFSPMFNTSVYASIDHTASASMPTPI